MLRALDDLVRQGKVRYIACSNYQAWRLMEALWISDANGLARFECYQPQYSLVVRDIEQEIIPLCQYKGLGVVVWSPLAGGFLSGKYAPGERTVAGTRSEERWAYPQSYFAPNADETLKVLREVAQETGRSAAQVALRWVVEQPAITSAIIGARTVDQARDNLATAAFHLEGAALEKLNAVSHLPDRYPESMEKNMHERRDSAVQTGGRR
jgi:aryl-alcohol dehydrogenase-like predicted oxidoreductase